MKRTIYPLYAPTDADAVQPILDALSEKGCSLRNPKGSPRKEDALLLFLSESVSAKGPLAEAFFRLNAGRELVIPVDLDGSTPPLELQSALMARHTLDGQKYGSDELADRIARAVEVGRKNRLSLILSVAAATILMAAGGIVLWKNLSARTVSSVAEDTAVPTAPATPPPTVDGIDVDLKEVAEVVYVGDTFRYYTMADGYLRGSGGNSIRSYSEVAYESWDAEGVHYYSTENGREIPMAELGDVSYLQNLPNLMYLTFVNVRGELPDLSGLWYLQQVTISHCDIPSLQGLAGCHMQTFLYVGDSQVNFSPLNDCAKLIGVDINFSDNSAQGDLSDFHPSNLEWLNICNAAILPKGLAQCTRLRELRLADGTATDLNFLEGVRLRSLSLDHLERLTSLEGLQGMSALQELRVVGCRALRDISALEGLGTLTSVQFNSDPGGYAYLKDVSVLGTLPWLKVIGLYGVNVSDLNFLKELKIKKSIDLGFCIDGDPDYSGLAAIESYSSLHVNTCGNYAAAAPYLQDKKVRRLSIYSGGLVDLGTLPNVTEELDLIDCYNRDLAGMRELSSVKILWVDSCPYFTSFRGIENLPHTGQRGSTLVVKNCPRLADWSAIEGKSFHRLELSQLFTLPDFTRIAFNELSLGKMGTDVLPDLSCLSAIDNAPAYSFRFEDLPQLTDLSPLFRLHGNRLDVPPQVGEQAQGLVDDGRFAVCEIVYPNGGWDPNEAAVQLSSLEELDTLPSSLLQHVKSLTIIGDALVNEETMDVRSDWRTNPPAVILTDRVTGQETRVDGTGTLFTDLSRLSALTGLESLTLWHQPLTSLEGIQALENLRSLSVSFCPSLSDVSAAFTVQTLRTIAFDRCPIGSLQGVQNLYDLEELSVCSTKISSLAGVEGLTHLTAVRLNGSSVKDFSSLGQVDFAYAMENGGVQLDLSVQNGRQLPRDAFAFLANVPGFARLTVHGIPVGLWLDAVMEKPIQVLYSDDTDMTQDQFAALAAAHPELESVSVAWNRKIRDVSCLLGLEDLREVWLSPDMTEAIASLGEGYGFELLID